MSRPGRSVTVVAAPVLGIARCVAARSVGVSRHHPIGESGCGGRKLLAITVFSTSVSQGAARTRTRTRTRLGSGGSGEGERMLGCQFSARTPHARAVDGLVGRQGPVGSPRRLIQPRRGGDAHAYSTYIRPCPRSRPPPMTGARGNNRTPQGNVRFAQGCSLHACTPAGRNIARLATVGVATRELRDDTHGVGEVDGRRPFAAVAGVRDGVLRRAIGSLATEAVQPFLLIWESGETDGRWHRVFSAPPPCPWPPRAEGVLFVAGARGRRGGTRWRG